jgi:hypothetical protein
VLTCSGVVPARGPAAQQSLPESGGLSQPTHTGGHRPFRSHRAPELRESHPRRPADGPEGAKTCARFGFVAQQCCSQAVWSLWAHPMPTPRSVDPSVAGLSTSLGAAIRSPTSTTPYPRLLRRPRLLRHRRRRVRRRRLHHRRHPHLRRPRITYRRRRTSMCAPTWAGASASAAASSGRLIRCT